VIFEPVRFRFARHGGNSLAKTGPDGHFCFDRPDTAFGLAAASNEGYAETMREELATSGTLTLKPWGKIEGRARIGRRPAANQSIRLALRSFHAGRPGVLSAFHQIETKADDQGQFAFDRVIPGTCEVARLMVTETGDGTRGLVCWTDLIDVAPGQTVQVRIGGQGRPVIGRVVLKAAPGVRVDWRRNAPATLARPQEIRPSTGRDARAPRRYDLFAANFDGDGRFRIEDVPPGHFDLNVSIDRPIGSDRPEMVKALGRVRVAVDIPDGRDDVPVDLGEIEVNAMER
jgi:hypothetical protein